MCHLFVSRGADFQGGGEGAERKGRCNSSDVHAAQPACPAVSRAGGRGEGVTEQVSVGAFLPRGVEGLGGCW